MQEKQKNGRFNLLLNYERLYFKIYNVSKLPREIAYCKLLIENK